ncbi:MAG TPA: hypothetical protein DDW78_10455 [Treponema sp.]|nr:hypothetical protein [Treponema sp.]
MDGNDELNSMERGIVLQHLRDNPVPLTMSLEREDEDASAAGIPPAALFPVLIPAGKAEVFDDGIVVLSKGIRSIKPFVNQQVRIQFYFQHLGLCFTAKLVKSQRGYALAVPSQLRKLSDSRAADDVPFSAQISYTVQGSHVSLPCLPASGYDLLGRPGWDSIKPGVQSVAQELFERYVYELHAVDSESVTYLISVCRYLTEQPELHAVEGLARPLEIIYIDTSMLIVGSREQDQGLQLEADYGLLLEFKTGSNASFRRKLSLGCTVSDVYLHEAQRSRCYVCALKELKREDERFLSEYLAGSLSL